MSQPFGRNSHIFVDIDIDGHELTKADDLSTFDRQQIRILATAHICEALENLGLSIKERKNDSSKKTSSLWGMSLESLLKRDQNIHPYAKIPIIFEEIFNLLEARGVEVEGILRIPGAAARIRSLREHLEKQHDCGSAKYDWGDVRVNDLAALMKQFLRELPQPLLTNEWVEAFVVVGKIDDDAKKRQLLNYLVLALSDVHRDCLKRLLLFLDRVVEHEQRNKMCLSSVATIMAPNLFLPPRIHSQCRSYKIKKNEVDLAKDTSCVVEALIQNHVQLWTVPDSLMDALRSRYSALRNESAGPIKRMIFCGCFSASSPKNSPEEDVPALRTASQLHQVRLSLLSPNDRLDAGRGSFCAGVNNAANALGSISPASNSNNNVHGGMASANSNALNRFNASLFNSGPRDSLTLPTDDEAVINVYSRKSSLARTVTSLHLEATTTAGQVVSQFCRLHGVERLVSTPEEVSSPSPGSPFFTSRLIPGLSSLYKDPEEPFRLFLYEVGGNIVERKLDPESNMKEALNNNPNATWVVKNRLQTAK